MERLSYPKNMYTIAAIWVVIVVIVDILFGLVFIEDLLAIKKTK